MNTYVSYAVRTNADWGLPWRFSSKESASQCRRCGFHPWIGKTFWRRKWQPTAIFLPGKSHGQRTLVGYSSQGGKRFRHDWVTQQQNTDWIHNTWPPLKCPVRYMLVLEKDSSTSFEENLIGVIGCLLAKPNGSVAASAASGNMLELLNLHPTPSLWGPCGGGHGPQVWVWVRPPVICCPVIMCFPWETGESGQWLVQSCCLGVDGKQYLHDLW